MSELKDRIPVLDDIVHRVVAEHSSSVSGSGPSPGSRSSPDTVLSAETVDTLVDTLHREFLDRVTRSLHEAIAREEAGLRLAIRAHLEVTLPEIIADQGHEGPLDEHRAGQDSRTPSVPRPDPRRHHQSPDQTMAMPARSQRRKLRLPRKRKAAV